VHFASPALSPGQTYTNTSVDIVGKDATEINLPLVIWSGSKGYIACSAWYEKGSAN
jgi:hypothetical protein